MAEPVLHAPETRTLFKAHQSTGTHTRSSEPALYACFNSQSPLMAVPFCLDVALSVFSLERFLSPPPLNIQICTLSNT